MKYSGIYYSVRGREKIEKLKSPPFADMFTVESEGEEYGFAKVVLDKSGIEKNKDLFVNGSCLRSGHRIYQYKDGKIKYSGFSPFTINYYYDFACKKSFTDLKKYKERYKNITNGIVKNGCSLFGFKRLRYCNNVMDYTMPFAIYVPKNIDSDKKLPLFIYLHGRTCGGETNIRPFFGIERIISAVKKKKCIIVVPSIPRQLDYSSDLDNKFSYPMDGRKGFDGIFSGLFELLKKQYPIDEKCVYITGSSNGAFGVLCQLYLHPERYAAGIPMMGGVSPFPNDDYYEKLKDMPIWFVHSEDDKMVSIGKQDSYCGSDIIYDGLLKVGNNKLKYTRYKKYGHNAFMVFQKKEKTWCDWLFNQSK